MLRIWNVREGVLKLCCFGEVSSYYAIYGTSDATGWCLPLGSVNISVCVNSKATQAPFSGGSEEFTFFFNNNSNLVSTNIRSCYCLVHIPNNRDDINCFFSGSSCTGPYPVDFWCDISNCIVTKFNFVNNTGVNGYFSFVYGNVMEIQILSSPLVPHHQGGFGMQHRIQIYISRTHSSFQRQKFVKMKGS